MSVCELVIFLKPRASETVVGTSRTEAGQRYGALSQVLVRRLRKITMLEWRNW